MQSSGPSGNRDSSETETELVDSLQKIIVKYRTEFRGDVGHTDPNDIRPGISIPRYNLERDIKAQVIKLQRTEGAEDGIMKGFSAEVHDEVFKGQFPNQ